MLRGLFKRKEPEPEVVIEKERQMPTGNVVDPGADVRGHLLGIMGKFRRTDYTVKELREAAELPPIAGVIDTIMREVNSYDLQVVEKNPAEDDRAKDMLTQTIRNPNDLERTFRVASNSMMRDWLVLGRSYVQLLRKVGPIPSLAATRLSEAYLRGDLDAATFSAEMVKVADIPGPILGWIAHDPDTILPNVTDSGVWKTPAFYDVSVLGDYVMNPSPAMLKKCPSYTTDQMVMIQYTGTTQRDRRLTPPSPTSEAYPLIDILYAMLVLLRNKLDRPNVDKLLSFVVPKQAQQMTTEQVDTLVSDLRLDLASGTLPVLPFVEAMVADIGMGDSFEGVWSIFAEIGLICYQIFGAGGVQMIRMEGQGRQAAGQQMEAARKQAVGNMLRVIADDFVERSIIIDPYSPYQGLQTEWVDKAEILTASERLEREHLPLIDRGYPMWAVLEQDFPEKRAILEAAGVDPKSIVLPELATMQMRTEADEEIAAQQVGAQEGQPEEEIERSI